MKLQSWADSTSVDNMVYAYFKTLLRPTAQEKKKNPFKILLLIDNAAGHPRALVEMGLMFSCLLTQHLFCSPWIKVMSLLFNMLSRFAIAFLPRSKHLLISWLQSLSIRGKFRSLCSMSPRNIFLL